MTHLFICFDLLTSTNILYKILHYGIALWKVFILVLIIHVVIPSAKYRCVTYWASIGLLVISVLVHVECVMISPLPSPPPLTAEQMKDTCSFTEFGPPPPPVIVPPKQSPADTRMLMMLQQEDDEGGRSVVTMTTF